MVQHPFKVNDPSRIESPPQSRMTLFMFLSLLLVFLGITLWMVIPFAPAISMGAILAILSEPALKRLLQRGFKPKMAAALITLAVTLLIVAPLLLFLTLAVKQGIALGQAIAGKNDFSFNTLLEHLSAWKPARDLIGDPAEFQAQARDWVQKIAKGATTQVLAIAAAVPQVVLQVVLALVSTFFFILDGKKFTAWMSNKIPLAGDVREKVSDSFKNTTVSVIWATLAAALAQASVILFAFLILRIPAAFLSAGATFILAWIPFVGSAPIWITGALYLYYSEDSILRAALMIGFGIITGLIDNFVRPWVLKGRGAMHPLVSLLSIFGGIGVFGIVGVFLGPILAAILIALLQIWPAVYRRFVERQ